MNGYNITFMAYGQTGSGKTYSMIAPVGSFKNLGADDTGQMMEHYGLFPRAALNIYHNLNNSGKKYILTCNLIEDKWGAPMCMMTKKPIKVDPELMKHIGQ